MKTIDRIFITILVLIICASGIYAIKSFSKGREAINVVGEGQVEVAPDEIKIQLNGIYSGTEQIATEKFNQEIKTLEQELGTKGRTIKTSNKRFIDTREEFTPSCYSADFELKAPCLDTYITLQATGDNIKEKGENLLNLFEKKENRNVNYIDLSVNNSQTIIQEARKLALQDAKAQAETTATTLGVKLGRLLQTTEYKINEENRYGEDQNTYIYTQRFYGRDDTKFTEAETLKIIRKAYLTYDID